MPEVTYKLQMEGKPDDIQIAVSKNEKMDRFEIGFRSPEGKWTFVVTMSGIQFVYLLDRMDRVHMSGCDAVIAAYEEVK